MKRWVGISGLVAVAAIASGCVPTPERPVSGVDAINLTGTDQYAVSSSRSPITVSYGGQDGNVREAMWLASATAHTDEESCASWSAESNWIDQEGVALRVQTAGNGWRAITVTKNVYFGATWIFNTHVWDTTSATPYTPIATVDLSSTFKNGLPLPWSLCARVKGSTLDFVVWPSGAQRPAYGDATHGMSVSIPAGWLTAGVAGVYVGHLQTGDSVTFSN